MNQYSKAGIPIIKGIKRFLNRGNDCRLDLEEQKETIQGSPLPCKPSSCLGCEFEKENVHDAHLLCGYEEEAAPNMFFTGQ